VTSGKIRRRSIVKITKCDRCGKEFVGRNPEGFYEHIFDHRVYIDLCNECEPLYNEILQSMEVHNRRVLEQFLNSFKGD
jgi:ribosomal protein L31